MAGEGEQLLTGGALAGPLPAALPVDVDQETSGKALLNLWLHTVGPERTVPRPEAFYSQTVEILWAADLFCRSW